MYAYESNIFMQNCRALADAARACGARLVMLPEHALSIEVRGESVAFPIASDEREWAATTPEEAFYAAMLDAEARDDERYRVAALSELLGGDAVLENVLRAGGLRDPESRCSR